MKAQLHRGFPWIFALLVLVQVVVLLTSRLYPFTDLPNHLAAATIVRHLGDGANDFADTFTVKVFPKPNVMHLLFCGLPIFPTVEAASRVYFALYALLLPLGMWFLTRRLGGNPWISLLSLLLLYNHGVTWGFVGYTMAIPLTVWFLYFYMGMREGSSRDTSLTALMLAAVFLAHAQIALFCCMLLVALQLFRSSPLAPRAVRTALALLPAAVLIGCWLGFEESADPTRLEDLTRYYRERFAAEFSDRAQLFYNDNNPLFPGSLGRQVGVACFAAMVIPLLIGLVRLAKVRRDPRRRQALPVLWIVLAASLGCYLLLPSALPGQWNIYQRMGVFALLASVLLGSGLVPQRLPRAAMIAVCAICLTHGALWAQCFHEFQNRNKGFDAEFFPAEMQGQKLAGLMYTMRYQGRPVFIHYPSYYIVWKHGLATSKLFDYRFSSVHRKVDARSLPPYDEWIGRVGRYDGRFNAMPFLLVRGNMPPADRPRLGAFEEVHSRGPWHLYRHR